MKIAIIKDGLIAETEAFESREAANAFICCGEWGDADGIAQILDGYAAGDAYANHVAGVWLREPQAAQAAAGDALQALAEQIGALERRLEALEGGIKQDSEGEI